MTLIDEMIEKYGLEAFLDWEETGNPNCGDPSKIDDEAYQEEDEED